MKKYHNDTNGCNIRKDNIKVKILSHGRYKEAIYIAASYAIFGLLWILVSDKLLDLLTDAENYASLQTYKGLFYVIISAFFIYHITYSRMRRIYREYTKTESAFEQLQKAHEELLNLESELSYHKDLNNSIIDKAPVIILTWDSKARFLSMNSFGQKHLGYTEEDLQRGLSWIDLIPKEREKIAIQIYNSILEEKQFINYEGPAIRKDGKQVDILWSSKLLVEKPDGMNIYVSIGTDIEERKQYEERIRYLAFYDTLTNLPNRTMFENEVNGYVSKGKPFVIAYIDIDNFKDINDSLGHHVGDIFLQYMAGCLKDEIMEPDYIARLGGDEFAILYDGETLETVRPRLENIIKNVSKIWTIENNQFYITMSIGVVCYPLHGDDAATLYKNADIAMYEAKKEGKNLIYIYREDIREHNSEHARLIQLLQQAIEQDQFVLEYQPQYYLDTGEIRGAEALVRWIHPEEGVIPPGKFIPVAEQTGQIFSLERLIFKKALEQKALWEEKGIKKQILSINLSTRTLTSSLNFKELEAILDAYQVDYTKIVIEITETAWISEVDHVIRHLQSLKRRGIKIALDDFGTGYSSLNYLKKFPIDIVKLDRSFINSIADEGVDTLLIKNILAMAHDLKFTVVAEGIETIDQLERLRYYTCEAGQGYLLSKPISEEKLLQLLEEKICFKG